MIHKPDQPSGSDDPSGPHRGSLLGRRRPAARRDPDDRSRSRAVARPAYALSGLAVVTIAALAVSNLGRAPASVRTATARRGVSVAASAVRGASGVPGGQPDFTVPPPPQAPGLVPTIGTKTTQRIYGATPYQDAVSVTQHIWPAARPENAPGENDNVPDRPWGLTLVTPDDPLTAMTALPLVHFPDDAPVLYVSRNGIPRVTLDEIKRLGVTGISRFNDMDAFLVGAAANPAVEKQLAAIGVKYTAITAPDVYQLANKVDQLYGRIQNPDTGVPQMETSASTGGNGVMDVMIASTDAWKFALPATHWVSHMPTALLWVNHAGIPAPTVAALKRRMGRAQIYVWGGPDQVSPRIVRELNRYGTVTRITNNDAVAFNATPQDTPEATAIAFAKMWDPVGMVGWGITGPGHGFTLVNINDWQAAVASAPLSHLGFHAPLLLTDSATTLPPELEAYFTQVAPTFLTSPADGPYNMTYVVGSWGEISWPVQARVDFDSEMSNRHVWSQTTGSRYSDSGQP